MNNKTYYGKMKRRGLKVAAGAGKTLSSPKTDPNYSVPEQDVDDL